MQRVRLLTGAALAALALAGTARAASPLLLQHPSLSATQIAFDYAGEIWTVPRAGGQATPLVVGQYRNSGPIFSPDGKWIAFTGTYDSNPDVYVVAAGGGQPRRLTWHPGADDALGWTPDGKGIVFRSQRATPRDLPQLYVVPAAGGAPVELPLPSGYEASLSPDGTHLAYTPFPQWQPAWKKYRGGQTARIWLADLADSHVVKIPRDNSNDRNPVWIGDQVYFLSDRDGPVTLYAYDTKAGDVRRVVDNPAGFDVASAAAGPGGIVYDQFGTLKLYDFATKTSHAVDVTLSAELPQTRPHVTPLSPLAILSAAISPTGKRVLFEAHGEILSAPAEKGSIRNLTQSPGVADRDPAASPDGKSVAFFSDESGEYALHIAPADGLGAVRKISLGTPPSYFYHPVWSPDSGKIALYDKRLNLWLVDLAGRGSLKRVDTDLYDSPSFSFDQSWSPDGKWLAYTKQLPNHLHAGFVYSLDSGRATQITDGLADVAGLRFDRGGAYLYFTASTNLGAGAGWLDMSSLGRPTDGAVYAIVLRKDGASPVKPESDEEAAEDDAAAKGDKPADAKAEAKGEKAKPGDKAKDDKAASVKIDFDGIDQRIVALPIPRANFAGLEAGEKGVVFTRVAPVALSDDTVLETADRPAETLFRYDGKTRKNIPIAEGIDAGSLAISADGKKILFSRGKSWFVTGADSPVKPGDGLIRLEGMSVDVDPRAEWQQMYHEVWRIERDFLYDPKTQGLDIAKAERVYAPFLERLGGRADLNVLFEEMTGHIGVGHTFIRGGDMPRQPHVSVGLLGADYEVVGDRYKISHILRGENWNPKLTAPLSEPGVAVAEGEFLLAVNGQEVHADREVYAPFEGLAGKQVVISVGPHADGTNARDITVVPVADEKALRLKSWMDANRKRVDELSGGKLAYVYLPDTAAGGFANFNRYYFAQVGKLGAVIDERFNHGGDIADAIVDQMRRKPMMVNASREGAETVEPSEAIYGPKVMIINQMSGSGGDALPWLFHKQGIGPLVGVRTWGGLVGIGGYPPLLDGGEVTAPRWALYGTTGQWEVENIGIPPDIEVEQDPALVRQGHDPQLERAVTTALEMLAKTPPAVFPRAVYPDRHPILPE